MNMIEMEFIKESNITSFLFCIYGTIYQNECGENSYLLCMCMYKKMYVYNIMK